MDLLSQPMMARHYEIAGTQIKALVNLQTTLRLTNGFVPVVGSIIACGLIHRTDASNGGLFKIP